MNSQRFFRIIPILLLLLLVGGIVPAGIPVQAARPTQGPAPVAPDMLGMVIRDPWYEFDTNPDYPDQPNRVAQERMGAILAEMGVRWVRLEFHISDDGATVEEHIARHDYFINVVAPRYNLKVLGLLGFGVMRDYPPYEPDDPRSLSYTNTFDDPLYGGGVNEYMHKWLDRACLITNRYRDRVAAYEILNEQNRLPPDANGVPATIAARLHTKFYRIFRQEHCFQETGDQTWRDTIQIILGGLHPKGTREPGDKDYVSDREYIQQIYASDGFVSYQETYGHYPLDGAGYHPYPEEIRLSLQSDIDLIGTRLDAMRLLLNQLDERQPPFWITEIGYNAGYLQQNETGQAAMLRAFYTSMALRTDIAGIFWFKYEDFPPAMGANAQKWGVVQIPFSEDDPSCPGNACYEVTGQPLLYRPAFWTYRELAGLPVERVYMPFVPQ